jgi:ABC-type branched-subunit amino acid transport system ATPase component
MTILVAENLSIDFGGVRAVDNVSFTVNKAEISRSSGQTAPARPHCST